MTDQVQHNQFVLPSRVNVESLYTPGAHASGGDDNRASATEESGSYGYRLTRSLSRVFTFLVGIVFTVARLGYTQTADSGGAKVIFRRENRGESFQRQISNLRQQPSDAPGEDDDREYEYEDYDSEDAGDTSRFSTEQGTPSEGISFPATRSEVEEAPAEEVAPPPAPTYTDTARWQPATDSSTSIIAANTHWNGTLKSEGALRIHGQADGELHSATDLFVAEGAEIDASLYADSVVVAGLVRGKIEARTRLEILPQGEVTGDVRSPKLVVHEGATISGQLKMEGFESRSTYSQESNPASTNET